jgi:hypothetical protein
MPTFSLKGKFSLDPPSVPKIGIKWNREGGIFDKPTIFNTRLGLQGVGEAVSEAIAPLDKLVEYVSVAVRTENEGLAKVIISQNRLLIDTIRRIVPKEVVLDTGAMVGSLTPAIDAELADRLVYAQRGNVR